MMYRYYEDKNVYKRYGVDEGEQEMKLQQREYDPNENRCNSIKLNDKHWRDQWYLVSVDWL